MFTFTSHLCSIVSYLAWFDIVTRWSPFDTWDQTFLNSRETSRCLRHGSSRLLGTATFVATWPAWTSRPARQWRRPRSLTATQSPLLMLPFPVSGRSPTSASSPASLSSSWWQGSAGPSFRPSIQFLPTLPRSWTATQVLGQHYRCHIISLARL